MNRRDFLRSGIPIAGAVVGGGACGLYLQRSYERTKLAEQLISEALPILTDKAKESTALPHLAREDVRRYFQGKCLNVAEFVREISSIAFHERLRSFPTNEQRHQCLLMAFCGKVVTEAEILHHFRTVAEACGSKLDRMWEKACEEICSKWRIQVGAVGLTFDAESFMTRLTPMIRGHLNAALQRCRQLGQTPALGETLVKSIGESVLLLSPVVRLPTIGLAVGLPACVLYTLMSLAPVILAKLAQRSDNMQAAISAELALLGNSVGSEYFREIREQIANLQRWQEEAIQEFARQEAEKRVGLLR